MILLKYKVDDNMNKKGFTTIELVVSFAMIAIILASLLSFTIYYRDKVKNEEIRSQLLDFKNTITKVVYDDIISGKIVKAEYCAGSTSCINLIGKNNEVHVLKIITDLSNSNRGIYLNYDGTDYMLPDSDIYQSKSNADTKTEELFACSFNAFELSNYNNLIYNIKIKYRHYLLDEEYEILLTIT